MGDFELTSDKTLSACLARRIFMLDNLQESREADEEEEEEEEFLRNFLLSTLFMVL